MGWTHRLTVRQRTNRPASSQPGSHLCPASVVRRPRGYRAPLAPRCTCLGCVHSAEPPGSRSQPRPSPAAPGHASPPPAVWREGFSVQSEGQTQSMLRYVQQSVLLTGPKEIFQCTVPPSFLPSHHSCFSPLLLLPISSSSPSPTWRSRAMDSLGMISLCPRCEMKQSVWYWLCPRSSSPRTSARKIFTSCRHTQGPGWSGRRG